MSAPTSVYATPMFWERLWRTAGIQAAVLFIIAYVMYGDQPQVGASPNSLVAFYDGHRVRILTAAVLVGLAGGCGARRLGRGSDRVHCAAESSPFGLEREDQARHNPLGS